jgi:F-box-like
MTSNRPHAYHLPSETELAHTQVVIAYRRDRIQFIDQSIEEQNIQLDGKIKALEAEFAPSIASVKAEIKRLIEREEGRMALLERGRATREESLREATRKRIQELEQERAELDKEIGNDKGFIAPIRRLPSELLSEVFIWSEINGNPWPITKVCRSWRSVALRTPQLWNHIVLTEALGSLKVGYGRGYGYMNFSRSLKTAPSEEEREGSQRCKTIKGLQNALKLAGNTRLRIIISIGHADHYAYLPVDLETKKERIKMLDLLTEHFPRIQSLIIKNLPDVKFQREGIDLFQPSVFLGKLQVLEELEVASGAHSQFITTLMTSVRSSARNLQSLTYSQPSAIWGDLEGLTNVKLAKESLSTLTSLRLGPGLIPFENAVWESMANLEELEFSGHVLVDWSALSLPNLRRLTITGGTGRDLGGHLPRLKYLYLDGVALEAPAFSIYAPELETLIIENDHLEVARMIEAPALDSLEVFSRFMKKVEANQLITTIWDDTAGAGARCLNPRKLRIDVDANDGALVKALKQMNRIEDLQVGIRAKMNLRRKLLADLALKTKKTTKGMKEGVPVVCPNLTRLEVFPGPFNLRERSMAGPGDKLQVQNLLDGITTARPDVECVMKEASREDNSMCWDYMDL